MIVKLASSVKLLTKPLTSPAKVTAQNDIHLMEFFLQGKNFFQEFSVLHGCLYLFVLCLGLSVVSWFNPER